ALGMLCYGVGMPLAGYLVARRGTRDVLLIGTAIVVLSAIWTVTATSVLSFTLAFGVALSIGLALTSPVALTPIISRWFTVRRGMALFFLSTGSMAGIAVVTPVLAWAVESFGWRPTLIGFAAVFTALAVPVSLALIRDNAPPETDTLIGSKANRAAGSPARTDVPASLPTAD